MTQKSRTRRLTSEEKRQAIEWLVVDKCKQREIARRLNVNPKTIRYLYNRWQEHGTLENLPNQKYPDALKEAVMREVLERTSTLKEIAKKYQITSEGTLRGWITKYNKKQQQRKGDQPNMNKSQLPTPEIQPELSVKKSKADQKLKIILECLRHHKNYALIADKYEMSYQTLYTWVKQYEKYGVASIEDRRGRSKRSDLEKQLQEKARRIQQLEAELFALKKLNAFMEQNE